MSKIGARGGEGAKIRVPKSEEDKIKVFKSWSRKFRNILMLTFKYSLAYSLKRIVLSS